jgi:VWFA-related protein
MGIVPGVARRAWTLVLAVFVCFSTLAAQETPPDDVIKIQSELVALDIQVVSKKNGRPVGSLGKEHFTILEDGVAQEIATFGQDKLPLSVTLLFDVSPSVKPVFQGVRDGALAALRTFKPEDEIAVMAFSGTTGVVQEFTRDRELVAQKIQTVGDNQDFGIGTRIRKGVYEAALHLRRNAQARNRRAIIVFTDNIGSDFLSEELSDKTVEAELYEADATVCGMFVSPGAGGALRGVTTVTRVLSFNALKPGNVRTYAEKTGGDVFSASKDNFQTQFEGLIANLRARYSVGYVSTNPNLDGKFRRIKVQVAPDVEAREGKVAIRTKRGYYAKPQANQ